MSAVIPMNLLHTHFIRMCVLFCASHLGSISEKGIGLLQWGHTAFDSTSVIVPSGCLIVFDIVVSYFDIQVWVVSTKNGSTDTDVFVPTTCIFSSLVWIFTWTQIGWPNKTLILFQKDSLILTLWKM